MTNKGADRKRQSAQRRGQRAEWFAAVSLRLKGYKIIERGFKTNLGEIDIIAKKGNLIALVEVKLRKDVKSALDAVDHTSQWRIASAGDLWISKQRNFSELSIRYDIIAVVPWQWPRHFPGAF